MEIGNWVRREGATHREGLRIVGPKWHRVESVVDGDAVTRCGRRMDAITPGGKKLEVSAVEVSTRMIGQPQNCSRC